MTIYLDLNIFDRIEKLDYLYGNEKETYSYLKNYLENNNIDVPYSNAHLNDLLRGWKKNPSFIEGHLNNIKKITNNLCICQYWGEKKVWWHKRDILEFFNYKIEELQFEDESFEDFLNINENYVNPIYAFKHFPLPKEWIIPLKNDEMAKIFFPLTIEDSNLFNVFADIYNFQIKLKSDYGLYRSLKNYLTKNISKLKNNKHIINHLRNTDQKPKHLGIDMFTILETYQPKFEIKENDNEDYYKIIETFYKFDFNGYKTDSNYNNMFDDALHTFYASHCDIFITNDERCIYKALKTYERLNIKTLVLRANEITELKK